LAASVALTPEGFDQALVWLMAYQTTRQVSVRRTPTVPPMPLATQLPVSFSYLPQLDRIQCSAREPVG
jgi:hypothetical protein